MIRGPLTPLEQSAAVTGCRFFRAPVAVYDAMRQQIDADHDFPAGVGTTAPTITALPSSANLPKFGSDVLLVVGSYRIGPEENAMISSAIQAGQVSELTGQEFESLISP